MEKMKVRITFNEEVLGSAPANKDIYTDYVALNNPNYEKIEEEIESIPEDEKGVTVFPRMADGNPAIYDYQIRGYLKESIGALAKAGKDGYSGGKACSGIKAYKKTVDQQIFVKPRMVPYQNIGEKWSENIHYCERPLRAATPMGERIALAKSETVPAGAVIEFEIILLSDKLYPVVIEALDYGELHGMSQWRNSGKGTFTYELLD